MDPTIQINERVDMVVVYRRHGDIASLCVPAKMRWRGREIELSELALRHPTVAGKRMVHVFHMSDGVNGYRLEFDAEALTWTLICLISGEDHA
ncbi:MAG TPA: hypothetical protein VFN51_03890 [Candidatus Saccharimonadales bacterium]|nr:hypothetical protein [Candidatus Saccharimonadales bacterium]